MTKNINLSTGAITIILCVLICACNKKNTKKDTRCPILVEMAKSCNNANGPMGMSLYTEYIDSIYKTTLMVDENITTTETINSFYGNEKSNMMAVISSSTGETRNRYQLMVYYHVTFEYVVKSKNTGKVIVHFTITPEEIKDALSSHITKLDEIKMRVKTIERILPRTLESGYTMNDISCTDDVINIEIIVDDSLRSFDEATRFRTCSPSELAITLGSITVGWTFWNISSQVPIGFCFHFIGSKNKDELNISFSKDEVVEYNEIINRIQKQQTEQNNHEQ